MAPDPQRRREFRPFRALFESARLPAETITGNRAENEFDVVTRFNDAEETTGEDVALMRRPSGRPPPSHVRWPGTVACPLPPGRPARREPRAAGLGPVARPAIRGGRPPRRRPTGPPPRAARGHRGPCRSLSRGRPPPPSCCRGRRPRSRTDPCAPPERPREAPAPSFCDLRTRQGPAVPAGRPRRGSARDGPALALGAVAGPHAELLAVLVVGGAVLVADPDLVGVAAEGEDLPLLGRARLPGADLGVLGAGVHGEGRAVAVGDLIAPVAGVLQRPRAARGAELARDDG